MKKPNSVNCSFTTDRNVIKYETSNAETIEAIEEVRKLKENPNKKTYSYFSELMKDIENAEL